MSEIMRWFAIHGKDTLEVAGIIGGLFFTAVSFHANTKERRVSNLMSIAKSHRDLWLQVIQNPELARILQDDVDLESSPITPAEERFVHLLILHLFVTFEAVEAGLMSEIHGLKRDVRDFFSRPIPKQVWYWSRQFQEARFRAFVDGIRFEFQNSTKASK